MAGGGLSKYEQGRIFLFPFSVDGDWLKKFDERARIHLSKILSELEVDFASETRFQDLSSLRFDNFTDFLSKAGDRKDPESVVLRWAKFAVTANADLLAGEISLVLTTEKRLLTQDNAPGDFSAASIELRVSGSDQTMTESAYYDLEPYIKSSCLGGIYRPLWIFRNKWFIQIVSQILSWMGLFIGMNLTNRLFDHGAVVGTAKTLENILSTADLSKKLDLLATWLLAPSDDHWWRPIVVVGAGAVTFGLIYVLGLGLLPKLTPNSSIAIGLASRRARQYENAFRFVVFSLILLGILVPLLIELVKLLF